MSAAIGAPFRHVLNKVLTDYYRCPDEFAGFVPPVNLSARSGYFRFGDGAIGYGRTSTGNVALDAPGATYDALAQVSMEEAGPRLPFDPAEVMDNLRCERYIATPNGNGATPLPHGLVRDAYYLLRPLMPVALRRHLQKHSLRDWQRIPFPSWPVDRSADRLAARMLVLSLKAKRADRVPFIWFWPEGHASCAVVTHDVEQPTGLDFCERLMDIDESAGIKASFQIVPEKRYAWTPELLSRIRDRGFEVNVHDFNHDGNLYRDRSEFLRRAAKINHYAREFEAEGFRSGALYRNLEWYSAFDFSYDMSVPNVAHLDPQRGGCCTVMPYFIGKVLELPLTAIQDYSLFHILGEYSIEVWKRQIEIISKAHGLSSFIVHPDYVIEDRARRVYQALLAHLSLQRSETNMWIALPGEVVRWWRQRSRINLVKKDETWRIEGEGSDRARLAYASLDGEEVKYSLAEFASPVPIT